MRICMCVHIQYSQFSSVHPCVAICMSEINTDNECALCMSIKTILFKMENA